MELKKWAIAGIVLTVILGSLFHFIYEWSGFNPLVAVFGSVNESTWEHLKLLFWPMFFFAVLEYFTYGKNLPNFIAAKVFSIILGLIIILAAFYTYTGIIGDHYLLVDIAIFILTVCIAYYYNYKLLTNAKFSESKYSVISLILLIALIVCFVVFTFAPPQINLFLDPVNNFYGIG